jgi:hypothetical protein
MGGGQAYRMVSLVSAVMLARIGPVKPFWDKPLIARSEACGRAEDEPPTRSHALPQRRTRRQRARSARTSRPGDRPGGAAYRAASLVSAVMLARIGPLKPFPPKFLIAHSEACCRAEDEPLTRSRCARKATQEGGAQARERGQRGDRRRHAAD